MMDSASRARGGRRDDARLGERRAIGRREKTRDRTDAHRGLEMVARASADDGAGAVEVMHSTSFVCLRVRDSSCTPPV